jgi:hypothetical protein
MMNQALNAVIEFEQLLLSPPPHALSAAGNLSSPSITAAKLFDPVDIDDICATTYNWGVTLMELGQFVLAEKFISKALHLLAHTTPTMLAFHTTIQVGCSEIFDRLNS